MYECEDCKMKSDCLEEVCWYDINGNPYRTEQEIENNSNNPDALAHLLCGECAYEKFK